MHRPLTLIVCALAAALPPPAVAQQAADTAYVKSEAMIPMRDGVKLRVVILALEEMSRVQVKAVWKPT